MRTIPDSPITITDFGFTGQRELGGTGLMDYRARFYSQSLGRFLQPDSVIPNSGNPQEFNRYSYVNNAPINFNDPTGHKACDEIDANGTCYTEGDITEGKKETASNQGCSNPTYCENGEPKTPDRSLDEMIPRDDKPWYIDILAYQYTPLIASGINVLATDIAFLALALSPTPLAPATIAIFLTAFIIGRAASLISSVSTGYQYQQNLYGTTKNDVNISLATTAIGVIPKPQAAVANHFSFVYTALRTFGVVESP